jgi:hypothetical protein
MILNHEPGMVQEVLDLGCWVHRCAGGPGAAFVVTLNEELAARAWQER